MIQLQPAGVPRTEFRLAPLAVCILAVVLMGLAQQMPAQDLYGGNVGRMLSTHLLLELFSIVGAILVAIVAWHTVEKSQSGDANSLVFGFCVVAGVDLMHALSYPGMPALMTENSTSKAIFFWLCGRFFELIAMVLVASRMRLPGRRVSWLALALGVIAIAGFIGNYHLDKLPVTFIEGKGVTPFKAQLEYFLCVCNLIVAAWFFRLSRHDASGQSINLAVASFITGIGELAFTNYTATSDFINVTGHVYKVIAYSFIFRAAFIAGLRLPYRKLLTSEKTLARQQNELQTLLGNLPVAVVRLDRDLKFGYVNPCYEKVVGKKRADVLGKPLRQVTPSLIDEENFARLLSAMLGHTVEFENRCLLANGEEAHFSIIAVPERNQEGDVEGILVLLADTTLRTRALHQLIESQKEIFELKAAIDAHAIVAVTDARGVILNVNENFCTISQYTRDELIGNTHNIINSGHHPRSFFIDMWQTISSGKIWNGEICNRAKNGTVYWVHTTIVPFLDGEGRPVQYFAIRADITKRKRAEEEASRMAFHDSLTGLLNRRRIMDRLRSAIDRGCTSQQYCALFLFDLDHFKEINDTIGHAAGDEVLRDVAGRLVSMVGLKGTIARLGGDEFVILTENLGTNAECATGQAADFAEQVLTALRGTYRVAGQSRALTLSMGVVMFQLPGALPYELLKQAEIALYKAKEEGRNQLRFFDPSLQAEITARTALINDLRLATDRGELRLYYQPVVQAEGRILGAEALLRWQHPVRGMVSPAEFIPIAEQTNLIQPIGSWVLRKACEQLKRWSTDPVRSSWTLAVNVSARQLYGSDFVAQVLDVLDETGANPYRLRLELTETMLQNNLDDTVAKMRALQRHGVRFALDDFGTGYSSLSYLKVLPLDQLKIDRSFVSDVLKNASDAAIVRTIMSLATNLNLRVVAEGVETQEQFDFLVEQGCQAFQGYLFGRPVPVERLAASVVVGDGAAGVA